MVFAVFQHRPVGREIGNGEVVAVRAGFISLDKSKVTVYKSRATALATTGWKHVLNRMQPSDYSKGFKQLVTDGDIVITYSDLNSVGVLTLTLDPNHEPPKCGDIVKLYSGELGESNEAAVLFRGTVVRFERSLRKYQITVEDTLGMLRAKSTFAVGRQTGINAIGKMLDSAGVIWYITPTTLNKLDNEKYSELYSNVSYLDGIRDIFDKILIQKGHQLILRDIGGVIEITKIDEMRTNHRLERFWMEDYTLTSSIEDGVFNRVMISTSDNGINSTAGRLKDTLTNVIWSVDVDYMGVLAYGRIMTYTGSAQITRMADALAKLVMQNKYAPEQTLDLRGVPGIEGLIPGNSILLAFRRPDGDFLVRVIIKSITHTWGEQGHRMDINTVCDLWRDTAPNPNLKDADGNPIAVGRGITTYNQTGGIELI
jgi:hypothetical protein